MAWISSSANFLKERMHSHSLWQKIEFKEIIMLSLSFGHLALRALFEPACGFSFQFVNNWRDFMKTFKRMTKTYTFSTRTGLQAFTQHEAWYIKCSFIELLDLCVNLNHKKLSQKWTSSLTLWANQDLNCLIFVRELRIWLMESWVMVLIVALSGSARNIRRNHAPNSEVNYSWTDF